MIDNNKPNVVYILTDQWRAKATGYNGDPNAITPNIDQLAAESIDFANAIATSPVCTPARAAANAILPKTGSTHAPSFALTQ